MRRASESSLWIYFSILLVWTFAKRLKCLAEIIVVAVCSLIVLVEEYLWIHSLATMTAIQYKSWNIGLLSVYFSVAYKSRLNIGTNLLSWIDLSRFNCSPLKVICTLCGHFASVLALEQYPADREAESDLEGKKKRKNGFRTMAIKRKKVDKSFQYFTF